MIRDALQQSMLTGSMMDLTSGRKQLRLRGSQLNVAIFEALDNNRTLKEIVDVVMAQGVSEDRASVAATLKSLCELFYNQGWMFLRDPSVDAFRYIDDMSTPTR